jgi:hypothetical protein
MAWLIIRIEENMNLVLPGEKQKEKETLTARHQVLDPKLEIIKAVLFKHGYELGPIFGPIQGVWPYTAYIYVSPNKNGFGRCGSQLRRWPVRKIEEAKNGI